MQKKSFIKNKELTGCNETHTTLLCTETVSFSIFRDHDV